MSAPAKSTLLEQTLGRRAVTTTAAFLERWLETVVRPNNRPKTYATYRTAVRRGVVPYLGAVAIGKLTAEHVAELLARLSADGKSVAWRRYVHGVLSSALDVAAEWGLLDENPARKGSAQPPRAERRAPKSLSKEEAKAVREAARRDELEAAWVLALTAGIRGGELIGLHLSDVAKDYTYVEITGTVVEIDGVILGKRAPKTDYSVRRVWLTDEATDVLRKHVARRRAEMREAGSDADDAVLFPGPSGGYFHKNTLRDRFGKLLERAGVTRVNVHALRHTAATLALEAGARPEVVSANHGHASTAFTLDRYVRIKDEQRKEMARTMNGVFS